MRDPVSKFESKYYYSRNLPGGKMYDKIRTKLESNNKNGLLPPWMSGLSKEAWRRKPLSECVLDPADGECPLETGVAHDDLVLDLTIVRLFSWNGRTGFFFF